MRARVGTIMLCILSKLEASWSAVLSYFIRRPFDGRRTKKQQPNRPPHVAQSLVPALGALTRAKVLKESQRHHHSGL